MRLKRHRFQDRVMAVAFKTRFVRPKERAAARGIGLIHQVLLLTLSFLLIAAPHTATGQTNGFRLEEATIQEINEAFEIGVLTSEELVQLYLNRIEAYDQQGPALNSIINLNPNALVTARALDVERKDYGPRSPLHGIPVLLKDNQATFDVPTTDGSLALEYFYRADDAILTSRLRANGAVILGKTNLDEFGFAWSGRSSLGGQTRNPYDTTLVPGGSSGGTGAALAANLATAGVGNDSLGSVRVPSSLQALVGLKPTLGLIPLSSASRRAVHGPMGRSVTDVALMLDAMAGPDPADPVSLASAGHLPNSYLDSLNPQEMQGTRLGVVRPFVEPADADSQIIKLANEAIAQMAALGAEIVDPFDIGIQSGGSSSYNAYEYSRNSSFQTSARLAPVASLREFQATGRYLPQLDLFPFETLGGDVPPDLDGSNNAIQEGASRQRAAFLEVMDQAGVDAIVYPTLVERAAQTGRAFWVDFRGALDLGPRLGLPSITVPAGFTSDGIPLGIEMLGRPYSEPKLIGLAYAFEQATQHRRPPSSTPPLAGEMIDYRNFLDDLCTTVASGGTEISFDLNGDGVIAVNDVTAFLTRTEHSVADVDFDGDLNFADFLVLADHFGERGTWFHGDLDCDGIVTMSDFLIQSAQFSSASAAEPVPEPEEMGLIIFSAICLLFCRHHQRPTTHATQ